MARVLATPCSFSESPELGFFFQIFSCIFIGPDVGPSGLTTLATVRLPTNNPLLWDALVKAELQTVATDRGLTLPAENVHLLAYSKPTSEVLWTKDVTRSSVGTAWRNAYNGANGEPQLVMFLGYSQYRFIVHVNKVGTGVQSAGLVDIANGANLISLDDSLAAGEHELDSGWVNCPAWMSGEVRLKPGCKSTVAADSPVYRGFQLYLR